MRQIFPALHKSVVLQVLFVPLLIPPALQASEESAVLQDDSARPHGARVVHDCSTNTMLKGWVGQHSLLMSDLLRISGAFWADQQGATFQQRVSSTNCFKTYSSRCRRSLSSLSTIVLILSTRQRSVARGRHTRYWLSFLQLPEYLNF